MTTPRAKRIRQILGIGTAAALILSGILLMSGCYGIYISGDKPFSREAVAQAFAPISSPICLSLGILAVNILAGLFLPAQPEKPRPEKQLSLILGRLHAKTDLSQCPADLQARITAQQRSRKLHRTIRNVLTVLYFLILVVYGSNPDNFHQSQINESMIRAMCLLLPCLLVPILYGVFTAFHSRRSMETEIALLKTAPKEALRSQASAEEALKRTGSAPILRRILLGLAVAVLVYGFFTGGTADVLTKAINICTECVGLG